jgi:hypothetical protein
MPVRTRRIYRKLFDGCEGSSHLALDTSEGTFYSKYA